MVQIFSEISNTQLEICIHTHVVTSLQEETKTQPESVTMNYIQPRSALACLQELLPASVMDYKLAWNPTGMARYLCSVLIAQTFRTNVQSEQKLDYHYLSLYFIYLYLASAGVLQTTEHSCSWNIVSKAYLQ